MKFRLLLYCMLLSWPVAKAQPWNNYAAGNRYYTRMPDSTGSSAASIVAYIQSRYNTKREQLQAIYGWVTTNIRYDTDSSYYFNRGVDYETKIAATLRRGKGVCENFASLFTDLAVKIGVPSYVVYGYPASGNFRRNTGHTWSAVNLDDEWWLCDPTWDAGLSGSFKYFLVSPGVFIQTHIPFDPLWQLLEKPVGYRDGTTKNKSIFYYKDSVRAFLQSDSLQQFLAIERRMKTAGANNEMLKLWRSYNRMNIVIMAGEQDMRLYNAAVDNLNTATDLFNSFVHYRNNRFSPAKSDASIKIMLEPINTLIADAKKKLSRMGLLVENVQYNTDGILRRLESLLKRNEEQSSFLKKYFASAELEREQLFYR